MQTFPWPFSSNVFSRTESLPITSWHIEHDMQKVEKGTLKKWSEWVKEVCFILAAKEFPMKEVTHHHGTPCNLT
jgi:hypothetical protein